MVLPEAIPRTFGQFDGSKLKLAAIKNEDVLANDFLGEASEISGLLRNMGRHRAAFPGIVQAYHCQSETGSTDPQAYHQEAGRCNCREKYQNTSWLWHKHVGLGPGRVLSPGVEMERPCDFTLVNHHP
jgi:hypothetical protein